MIMKKYLTKLAEILFLLCSITSILALLLILGYVLQRGVPAINKIGFFNFIFGKVWQPQAEIFGILPMILASIYVTLGAVVIGTSIGIYTGIFLAEFSTPFILKIVRPAVGLLAAIPSVIYGFFGLIVIVPAIDAVFKNGGNSLLAATIILSVMILPTIISITEVSLRAVPKPYKEAAFALGETHVGTVFRVMLPAASSGIYSGVVLSIGRAIGETMAVILVAGNTVKVPGSILDRVRTLTANCALEMGYAVGLHQDALFATGVILFIFIIILNFILFKSNRKQTS